MEKQERQPKQEREPELHRPEEPVKDLEPDEEIGEAVKGGTSDLLTGNKKF